MLESKDQTKYILYSIQSDTNIGDFLQTNNLSNPPIQSNGEIYHNSLPPSNYYKFNCEHYESWLTFRDIFKSPIHGNFVMDKIKK